MTYYIVTDDSGSVVGQFDRSEEPTVPDDLTVQRVDSLSDYSVEWDSRLLR